MNVISLWSVIQIIDNFSEFVICLFTLLIIVFAMEHSNVLFSQNYKFFPDF